MRKRIEQAKQMFCLSLYGLIYTKTALQKGRLYPHILLCMCLLKGITQGGSINTLTIESYHYAVGCDITRCMRISCSLCEVS